MRHTLALHLAPLMLRLGLGLTFVWAGAAKLTQEMPVTPQNQAQLAAWGLIEGDPADDTTDPEPSTEIETDQTPEDADINTPVPLPIESPGASPAEPASEADDLVDPEPAELAEPEADDQANASLVAHQAEPKQTVRRVYGLSLLIHAAANPLPNEDGSAAMPLWPAGLASDKLPVYIAWVAAVTELVAGIAVLFGFFTRLGALPLAGTMGVAMWLTQVGPAIQSGETTLGFLPAGMFELGAGGYVYTQILWQFALLLMAGALFCLGSGYFSFDRLLFGPMQTPHTGSAEDNIEFVPMSGRQGSRPDADE